MSPETHQKTALSTELECLEWGCDFTSRQPFPICIDELVAHDCGGNHVES